MGVILGFGLLGDCQADYVPRMSKNWAIDASLTEHVSPWLCPLVCSDVYAVGVVV